MIESQDIKKYRLPDGPGVYLFKQNKDILYIGKATSLKDRVRSYFSNDLIVTRGPLIADLIFKADRISFQKTNSVLEALILESNLIKKYQPRYNTKEKDNKSFNYVVVTKEDFPRVLIVRGRDLLQKHSNYSRFTLPRGLGGSYATKNLNVSYTEAFGPYTNSTQLKEALKIIRKIFPFRDKCLPMNGKPCFNKQIGLCPGVCDGTINKGDYLKIIKKISLIFSGKIDNLKRTLKKEMSVLSKNQEFEKAKQIRDQIFALNHIADVSLIKTDGQEIGQANGLADTCFLTREEIRGPESEFFPGSQIYFNRIEAYDVAHLSGTNNVGGMVVMENGELKKSDYRKFNIRNSRGNDIGALKEVLERRFRHSEWPKPDLIVVDGGIAHYNLAKRVIKQTALVAVTKDEKHKAKAIIGNEGIISKYKQEILRINSEAHRFVITYHRNSRRSSALDFTN